MATLFNITHDADNLDEYDSTVTDDGDLSTGTPGLAATTAKMEVLIDDTTAIYGRKNFTAITSNTYRVRFYIDPNSIGMTASEEHWFLVIYGSSTSSRLMFAIRGTAGTDYQIRPAVRNDSSGFHYGTLTTITNAEHYIEAMVVYATGFDQIDAMVDWWIDGNHIEQLGGYDIYDLSKPDSIRAGATSGIDAATSGTLYLDEITANDDGNEIGPVVPIAGFASIF